MSGFNKHYNSLQESTSNNQRRPTTLQEELSLKWRMQHKYAKTKSKGFQPMEAQPEKKIGVRSVLAIYHNKNKIQRPRTSSHAR